MIKIIRTAGILALICFAFNANAQNKNKTFSASQEKSITEPVGGINFIASIAPIDNIYCFFKHKYNN